MIKNHIEDQNGWVNSEDVSNITNPVKKELEVILIYPTDIGEDWVPYAFYIISQRLKELGISYEIYEDSNIQLKSKTGESDWSFKIFGWTGYYEHIPSIIQWNQMLHHDIRQNSFTIVGGQTSIDKDARNYMLEWWIDAINVGQAGSFFDFLEKLKTSEKVDRATAYQNAKDVLATVECPEVPEWEFPRLDTFPLKACFVKWDGEGKNQNKQVHHIVIPPHEDCPNGCDFCSLMKIRGKEIGDSIANVISMAKKPVPKILFGWPTFEGKSLMSSKKILNAVKDVQHYTPESNIIMDSRQFQEKRYKKAMNELRECNVTWIRLWLDAIDGESAGVIGRKDNGRVRTDEEIQSEKDGILKFLSEENIEIFGVDMILTPFDTPKTVEKILTFYKEILTIGRERKIDVRMYLLPLIPYPWTVLHERYKEYINIQNYEQLEATFATDLSIRQFDKEPFGLLCEKYYLEGFNFLRSLDEESPYKIAYLNFLALSTAYQYLQGKREFEEIDIWFPEYKDDPVVKSIFEVIKKTAELE